MLKLHDKRIENFTLISAHAHGKCSLTLIGFKKASLTLVMLDVSKRRLFVFGMQLRKRD
jgi:hypothetical protein